MKGILWAFRAISISLTLSADVPSHLPDETCYMREHEVKEAGYALLQARAGMKVHEPELGDGTAIIPPVLSAGQNASKIGKVSTPGTWKAYYAGAENSMAFQWPKIYSMIQGSKFGQVLEVGAGACRNTEKLVTLSNHVLVTDIDPTAVQSCRQRFEKDPEKYSKLSFAVVDGVHVAVANESIDTIYQFDSGVHFHPQVIRAYLKEFNRVLVPGGTGFFHHSNLAASEFGVVDAEDVTVNRGWRSNMTKSLFEDFIREAGLETICHPLVTWGGDKDLDAVARFRKPGSETRRSSVFAAQQERCPEHIEF